MSVNHVKCQSHLAQQLSSLKGKEKDVSKKIFLNINIQNHEETTPPYAPGSSRFGSELPSVEDDVNAWRCAILRVARQKRQRP